MLPPIPYYIRKKPFFVCRKKRLGYTLDMIIREEALLCYRVVSYQPVVVVHIYKLSYTVYRCRRVYKLTGGLYNCTQTKICPLHVHLYTLLYRHCAHTEMYTAINKQFSLGI